MTVFLGFQPLSLTMTTCFETFDRCRRSPLYKFSSWYRTFPFWDKEVVYQTWGRDALPKLMKLPKGGGVIFNPKIYVANFENFKQRFLTMKLKKKSNFRVQGMFCIDIN